MKIVFLIFFMVFSRSALTWEALEVWNENLEQELLLNCDQGETLCQEKCGYEDQCILKSSFCRNCVGSGILLSYFYQNVGSWFVNTGVELNIGEFQKYLSGKNFIVLTYSGPYNIYSALNDIRMERAFNSLCPGFLDPYPIVLAELDQKGSLKKISSVICHEEEGARVYILDDLPPAVISNQFYAQFNATLNL